MEARIDNFGEIAHDMRTLCPTARETGTVCGEGVGNFK